MAIYLGENRVVDARSSGGTAPTLISKNITSNGMYTAASDGADGYSSVDVNVAGGTDELAKSIVDRSITSINNSEMTTIGRYAFAYCSSLITANFTSCTEVGYAAFSCCYSLTTASFPNCSLISNYAFYDCRSLETISFPNCSLISTYGFIYCYSLTTVSFPNCSKMGSYAFANCSSLTTVSFPICTSIYNYAFRSCYSLTTVSFPNCTFISSAAFISCYNLISFYLTGSSIPTLGDLAFYSTPIDGYTTSTSGVYGSIYVPASLYNNYLTATNWSTYSSRIVSI